jgi:hypothetical protein
LFTTPPRGVLLAWQLQIITPTTVFIPNVDRVIKGPEIITATATTKISPNNRGHSK